MTMVADPQEMDFNELTSIWRTEKANGGLVPVRKDLYPAMRRLLEKQKKEYEKCLSMDTSSLLFDGASGKMKNITETIKDIAERRMTKIFAMVQRASMGANNTIDAMTPEEKELYLSVLEISKKHWEELIFKKKAVIPDITEPDKMPEPVKEEPTVVSKVVENVVDENSKTPVTEVPEPSVVKEKKKEQEVTEIDEEDPEENPVKDVEEPVIKQPVSEPIREDEDGMVLIRILEDLPKFSGLNDITYNLRKEDVVRMPSIFAAALINRGVASQISL